MRPFVLFLVVLLVCFSVAADGSYRSGYDLGSQDADLSILNPFFLGTVSLFWGGEALGYPIAATYLSMGFIFLPYFIEIGPSDTILYSRVEDKPLDFQRGYVDGYRENSVKQQMGWAFEGWRWSLLAWAILHVLGYV